MEQPFLTIEKQIPFKQFTIYPLSDVHIGAHAHADRRFKERVSFIAAQDQSHRVLLMGDLMDNATRSSVSFSYGATTPQQELDRLVDVLGPIADRIDLVIPGNHERRSADRGDGLDVTAQLTALLGIPKVYRKQASVIRYQFNKRKDKYYRTSVELLCHHGTGGGRKHGGKVNRVSDLKLLKADCHCYLMGHVHHTSTHVETTISRWPPRPLRQLFIITGAWVGSEQYASDAAYPVPSIGAPIIHVEAVKDEPVLRVEVK